MRRSAETSGVFVVDPERFWRFVQFLDDADDTCWIWTGAMRDDGRGRYFIGNGEITAHRAAWEIRTGSQPPPGRRLEQSCNQPQCVRHWILGGAVQKIDDEGVRALRKSSLSIRELARRYVISRRHARAIKRCERRA